MYQSWEFYGWIFLFLTIKDLYKNKMITCLSMWKYITNHIDNHFSIWVIGYGDWHASMVLLRIVIIMDVIKEVNPYWQRETLLLKQLKR